MQNNVVGYGQTRISCIKLKETKNLEQQLPEVGRSALHGEPLPFVGAGSGVPFHLSTWGVIRELRSHYIDF